MIQKPEPKNGQKHAHDATSKTSSAEPLQQQQQRKFGRSSHVQDVAKQASGQGVKGNGGYHNSAGHGVGNGRLESERAGQANNVAPVQAGQIGSQGRPNGNGSSRPEQAANGRAASGRPQSGIAGPQLTVPRPSVNGNAPARGPSVGVNPGAGGPKHATVGSGANTAATAAGGRSRDAGSAASAHTGGSTAAVGNGTGGEVGANGARAREPRRRGGRGRGSGEGAADGAKPAPGLTGDAKAGAAGPQTERPDRAGGPRGGRRQPGLPGDTASADATADGSNAVAGAATADDAAAADPQRGGRPRGRRGRGGQQNGAPDGVEQGEGGVPAVEGLDQPLEQRPKQQRQRAPRDSKPNGQWQAAEQDGGMQSASNEQLQVQPGSQQQGAGSKPQRQRKTREPKPVLSHEGSQPQMEQHGPDAGERKTLDGARAGSRGQGRGGRRRNGASAEGDVDTAARPSVADGGSTAAQRQRPPRPPRQQQPADQPVPAPPAPQPPAEPAIAAPPAPPAAAVPFQQPGPLPAPQAPQPPPPQQEHPQLPLQHHQLQRHPLEQQFQQQPFQDVHPMMDFSQSLLQHIAPPQHQYQMPHEYHQQQHFLQQHQQHHHQPPPFDQAFHQFHQQQFMQQHMGPPPPGHGFMGGAFNIPGGHMAPPPPMPPFYTTGASPYGQMLPPPPPPAFAGAPTPPMNQPSMSAVVPDAQHVPAAEAPLVEQLSPVFVQEQAAYPHPVQPPRPEHESVIEQQLPQVEVTAVVAEEVAVVSAVAEPDVQAPAAAAAVTAPEQIVAAEAPAAEPVAAVEPVKNEWADRLAQQALARMNARSSFLKGASADGLIDDRSRVGTQSRSAAYANGNGSSYSPRGPVTANGGGAHAAEPENWRTGGESDPTRRTGSFGSNAPENWRNGAANGPAAPNDWRASLAPTGVADAAEAWRSRSPPDEAATRAPAPYQPPRREESPPPPSAASAASAGGRPRLNLQPRTKPPPQPPSAPGAPAGAAANGDAPTANGSAAASANSSRPSVFGAARPREDVLRQRGVTEPDRLTTGNVAYANGGGAGSVGAPRSNGRAGSVMSGVSDEDQWLTVGKGGRSKAPPATADVGNTLLDAASDPFFTGRSTMGHGVAIVGRSGQFAGGSYGKGSYGSHGKDTYMNAYGVSRGYGNSYGHEDDEPIFKRGLPTRQDGPF